MKTRCSPHHQAMYWTMNVKKNQQRLFDLQIHKFWFLPRDLGGTRNWLLMVSMMKRSVLELLWPNFWRNEGAQSIRRSQAFEGATLNNKSTVLVLHCDLRDGEFNRFDWEGVMHANACAAEEGVFLQESAGTEYILDTGTRTCNLFSIHGVCRSHAECEE